MAVVAPLRPSRTILALLLVGAVIVDARSPVEVELYRAMKGSEVSAFTIENNNLASLVGNLKYIHTEAIEESSLSPPVRSARKYGIDAVVRWSYTVRNPPAMVTPPNSFSVQVDFGPYTTFDHGVATNLVQQESIARYGSYVGVQEQSDTRFVYDDPYYWFSVTGFCPNLPWGEKGTHLAPSPKCMNYTSGGRVNGGLCAGGIGSGVQPSGEKDCTYTYGKPTVVWLDKLVGITEEDCGGRRCTDWADFRQHCTNESYRQKFDKSSRRATPFTFCVEYDIHPDCTNSCTAEACRALPEEQREIGLPFWRGRCSDRHNRRRAELLSQALGDAGATSQHQLASTVSPSKSQTCLYPKGMCHPTPQVGGMYCSRKWAGVCQPCWIPGAVRRYADARLQKVCPYNVLESADYSRETSSWPVCKSTRPRDLCCLYHRPSTCHPSFQGPLPLDDDGYALAAAKQDTATMAAFLRRVAEHKMFGIVTDGKGLEEFAYWEWGRSPKAGRTLRDVEADIVPFLRLFPTTTSTTQTRFAALIIP